MAAQDPFSFGAEFFACASFLAMLAATAAPPGAIANCLSEVWLGFWEWWSYYHGVSVRVGGVEYNFLLYNQILVPYDDTTDNYFFFFFLFFKLYLKCIYPIVI